MSFDPRSLERLRQLGRTLPQRLPAPEPPAAPAASASPGAGSGRGRRHPLETETDPAALFHELMQASADGSAPPHLLERLRELEARTAEAAPAAERSPGLPPTDTARPPAGLAAGGKAGRARRRRDPRLARDHSDLYAAFEQLLLEDDEI